MKEAVKLSFPQNVTEKLRKKTNRRNSLCPAPMSFPEFILQIILMMVMLVVMVAKMAMMMMMVQ